MSEQPTNPQPEDMGRQADDRLLHALLLHMHDPQAAEHRQQRVGRVMRIIEGAAQEPKRVLRFPVWAKRGLWAAAAMILVAVGLIAILHSPSPALAAIDDMVKSLARPGDRTFRIQVEPPDVAMPDDRPGLDQATLYLRDANQYVLVRRDPKGGDALDGYDGQQSWRIRAGVLVETKDGLGAGRIPMPQVMANVPFVDLAQTLRRIRVDYVVERFDRASLKAGGDLLRHVLARRKSHDVKGPETVEIWANPDTGMPQRIVFDEAKFQGSPQPRQLTLGLVSESTLAGDWFSPTAHTGKAGAGLQR